MRIELHPDARLELRESASYYESRSDGLGHAFVNEIEAAFDLICDAPERWPRLEEDVRRCLVHRFPYGVLYTVESEFVLVVAIMHCSRKPGYWRNRTGS